MYINGYVRSRKMKRLSLIAAFAAVANATLTIVADASVQALIPMPREMKLTGGSVALAAANSPKVEVVASIPPEGYELSITKDGVTIRHSDDAGLFYAKMTLRQLTDGRAVSMKPSTPAASSMPPYQTLPCLEIKDSPAFRWRGVLLDDSRHFFGKEVVKLVLEQMSWFKLNVFHWHLTDDQYWSLEIPEYPELVKHGEEWVGYKGQSKRPFGEKVGDFYYTANDVREILAYAKERHITVVPEIELPGHFMSVVRAYPSFACKGGGRVMCVGNPEAMQFAERVLDYVCELFPGDVVHIGGDECNRKYWKKCPRCKSLVRREGLKGVAEIQPWLTRRLAEHLAKKGRKVVGWEEIVVGFDKADRNGESENKGKPKSSLLPGKDVLVMGYHAEPGALAANMGYTVVQSPNWHCYFDYTQNLPEDPFRYFLPDRRWLPFENVYKFDPYDGVKPEARKNVIGGQCCNWTELTWNRFDLEWKLWPRGFALAEVLWTYPDPAKRDFAEFSVRAAEHRRRLIREGVNCAPLK